MPTNNNQPQTEMANVDPLEIVVDVSAVEVPVVFTDVGIQGEPGPPGPTGVVEVYEQADPPATTSEGAIWIETDRTIVPGTGPTGPPGPQGLPGPVSIVTPYSGLWFPLWGYGGTAAAVGNVNLQVDSIYTTRTVLPCAVKAIAINVGTAVATSQVRLLAYADTPTGPGALLYESSALSTTSTGMKQTAFVLPAGPVWIAAHAWGMAGQPALTMALGQNPYMPGLTSGVVFAYYSQVNAWKSFNSQYDTKNPFPMTNVVKGDNTIPAIFLQAT